MSNVVDFPQTKTDFLSGPFEHYDVIVEERSVPRLSGRRNEDGKITLIVDGRYGATFTEEYAYQAAWLIAQASAIASGYPCFSANKKDAPFAQIVRGISITPTTGDVVDMTSGEEQ